MYGSVRGVPGNRHPYRDLDADNLWGLPYLKTRLAELVDLRRRSGPPV
jgi:hypothetical protein